MHPVVGLLASIALTVGRTFMVRLTPSKRSFYVLVNGRNPNSIKPHPLNVIELIDDSPPVPTAIPAHALVTCSIVSIGEGESVRKQSVLVNSHPSISSEN